jgi:hypothetical protein
MEPFLAFPQHLLGLFALGDIGLHAARHGWETTGSWGLWLSLGRAIRSNR